MPKKFLVVVGWVVASYSLSSQAPTHVEVELGCDNLSGSSPWREVTPQLRETTCSKAMGSVEGSEDGIYLLFIKV